MFIRLIIQNRFHLLFKNFSIWNSLSDVLSAPLFVATISIHLCCLPRWISSRQFFAPEDFSVSYLPLRGLTIRRSRVCCSVCMRNGLRFTDSKHCFADDENTALHECFGHRPIRLTQCCTQFKSSGVKSLCVLYLYYNVTFTFKWYGNSWNKTFYSQRVWIGYNIEFAE